MIDGVSLEAYLSDRKLQRAVERLLEIMGEAARVVSPEMRDRFPSVPWPQMIGLRNVLVHEYGDIRQDVLWTIASRDVPALLNELTKHAS